MREILQLIDLIVSDYKFKKKEILYFFFLLKDKISSAIILLTNQMKRGINYE